MLYAYCHRLSRVPAPLRVSYNKLNPSHPVVVEGGPAWLQCGGSAFAWDERAGPRPPGMGTNLPAQPTNPLGLLASSYLAVLFARGQKPNSKWMWPKCTGRHRKPWGGGVACSGLHRPRTPLHSLPILGGHHPQAPSWWSQEVSSGWSLKRLRFLSSRSERESFPSFP